MLAVVLTSCAPAGTDTVADSADKSATATPRPTDTPVPASTKSATNTPLPTQTDVQPTAAPTYTPTAPPQATVCDPDPGANCKGADLSGADLTDADLRDADLSRANLSNANLSDANLIGANLSKANLSKANLERANLYKADLSGAMMQYANLSGANLTETNLSDANLSWAYLSDTDLTETNLRGADLSGSDLTETNLSGADLTETDLSGADLSGSDLTETNLSDADLDSADLTDADLSYADLREADLSWADLSKANLRDADLTGADLWYADLSGADLSGADLSGAWLNKYVDLRGATLDANTQIDAKWRLAWEISSKGASGRDLSGVDLTETNLSGADLTETNLSGADLSGSDLGGADLGYADLRGASVLGANLRMADLSLTNLNLVDLYGANYNAETKWPEGFDPVGAGAALGAYVSHIVDFDNEEWVTLSSGGLTAVLAAARVDPEYSGEYPYFVRPTMRIWDSGQGTEGSATEEPVLEYEGRITHNPGWLFQIVELDGANDAPEVLFSEYSGGNHCCASVIVCSQDSEGIWQTIDVGQFYTAGPFGAVALQGSDGYVMHTLDSRFHRLADCEACWRAPRRIFAIESGQVVDVSDRPAFVPLFREDARHMTSPSKDGNGWSAGYVKGWWAGYVATKARAGEFDEAWEMMLANYVEPHGFPEVLEAFLKATGYISAERVVD